MTARLPGIKQGASWMAYLDYSQNGMAEAFNVSELSAQMRAANNEFLTQLTIAADPVVVGRFIVSATPAQTSGWPIGEVLFDVKRTSGSKVTPTDTVTMTVSRRITL